jgi:hypothetical protein
MPTETLTTDCCLTAGVNTRIKPRCSRLFGFGDRQFCEKSGFMDSLMTGLKELGVPEERIFSESFSKGSKATAETKSDGNLESAEIVFAESGKTLTWNKGSNETVQNWTTLAKRAFLLSINLVLLSISSSFCLPRTKN